MKVTDNCRAIIVDDVSDTSKTLNRACERPCPAALVWDRMTTSGSLAMRVPLAAVVSTSIRKKTKKKSLYYDRHCHKPNPVGQTHFLDFFFFVCVFRATWAASTQRNTRGQKRGWTGRRQTMDWKRHKECFGKERHNTENQADVAPTSNGGDGMGASVPSMPTRRDWLLSFLAPAVAAMPYTARASANNRS